jgi:hypothetical protein
VVEEQTVRRIRIAAVIVAAEALGALAFGIAELARLDTDRLVIALTTSVFFLVYAVGLAFAARGLARLSGWSRAPVVLAQFIQLGVAWSFYGNTTTWVAILLAVPAVAVLVVVFSPATTDAIYGQRE